MELCMYSYHDVVLHIDREPEQNIFAGHKRMH